MASVIDARSILGSQEKSLKSAQVGTDKDVLEYDLGNLLLSNSLPLDKSSKEEETLKSISRDNVQALLNVLFTRPSKPIRNEVGRVIELPEPSLRIPREKPLPKPKPLTKWEKFAKAKGIQKQKRSRMVYDEEMDGWAPRWGYKKANDEMRQWLVEHDPSDDSGLDPWTRMKQERKERVAKNERQRLANLKAAGGRTIPGQIDLSSAIQPKPLKRNQKLKAKREEEKALNDPSRVQLGKKRKHDDMEHLKVSLRVAQSATASMGKFEEYRKREPVREDVVKRQRRGQLIGRNVNEEKSKSLNLLNKVLGE